MCAFALGPALAVPVLRELAQTGPAHPDRVARVQPHPAREVPVSRSEQCACRVLRARAEGGDADTQRGVMLPPVAVPAAPHLVDPPLGDSRAELGLMVHDCDLREVLRAPARPAETAAQIRLLRV